MICVTPDKVCGVSAVGDYFIALGLGCTLNFRVLLFVGGFCCVGFLPERIVKAISRLHVGTVALKPSLFPQELRTGNA